MDNPNEITFKLNYNRKDVQEIYFGDSLWKTYLTSERKDTLSILVPSAIFFLLLLAQWKSSGTMPFVILIVGIPFCIYLIIFFIEIRNFRRWYLSVLEFTNKEEEYDNSLLSFFENWIVLKTKSKENRWKISALDYVKIDDLSIQLFFTVGESMFIPKKSFEPDSFELFLSELDRRQLNIDIE